MRYDMDVLCEVSELLGASGVNDSELAQRIAAEVHRLYGEEELSIEVEWDDA